jgi:hypothetical protein
MTALRVFLPETHVIKKVLKKHNAQNSTVTAIPLLLLFN